MDFFFGGGGNTVDYDIPASLLAGDNDVHHTVFDSVLPRHADFPILPSLRTSLDASVAIQHSQ